MNAPLRMQRWLYKRYNNYLPKSFIKSYIRIEAEASPSLSALQPDISIKVSDASIAINRTFRRYGLILLAVYLVYATLTVLGAARQVNPDAIFIFVIIGGAFMAVLAFAFRWKVARSTAEYQVITRFFFAICFLERNAIRWQDSRFRWHVAKRMEYIARKVEQIPLASRSLAPNVRKEAFRLGMAKAQAIRQLELWAVRPMAFTFTDLAHQLVSDLNLMVENRWYDLPEANDFKVQRPRWFFILTIGAAVIIIGAAIFLVAYAAKTGPVASVIGLILVAIALALLNNVGISTSLIDQYLQTGSKVIPGK
jgi:hypothetical protein